jgi:hypothetical protein
VSEEERQIGRMLDQYGISFFYRQPTIVYQDGQNQLWRPAFTLPSYGGLVVDYVPGSGQPQSQEALTENRSTATTKSRPPCWARRTWTDPTGIGISMPGWSSCTGRYWTR